MAFLKYVGPHQRTEVLNFGHFGYGDEKQVDDVTAGAFKDPRCAAEGWLVRGDDEPPLTLPGEVLTAKASAPKPAGDALSGLHIVDDTDTPQHSMPEPIKK